jgi:hypothetical protein
MSIPIERETRFGTPCACGNTLQFKDGDEWKCGECAANERAVINTAPGQDFCGHGFSRCASSECWKPPTWVKDAAGAWGPPMATGNDGNGPAGETMTDRDQWGNSEYSPYYMKGPAPKQEAKPEASAAKLKPITPREARAGRLISIPDGVVKVVNALIVEKFDGKRAVVRQDDILAAIESEHGYSRETVIAKRWLDFEDLFEQAGWKVTYDSPAYNETGPSLFRFEPRPLAPDAKGQGE